MPRHAQHHASPPPDIDHPIFGEPVTSPDASTFTIEHGSDDTIYQQVDKLTKTQTVTFDKSAAADDALFTLADAYGPNGARIADTITQSGRIVFHAVGDTGASDVRRYQNEQRVADQVTTDAHAQEVSNRPSFFFHLGDVVYNFGEAKYYYDQFYEPFRAYPAPILAIPGNHDSFIVPGTPDEDDPLVVFARNFCSPKVVVTPEAGSLHRTAMTQPGVYYGFDAPFVRIVALFSNALEDPGVFSSQGGQWPNVPDLQEGFLRAQLQKVKDEGYKGALLFATHHPPYVYSPPADKNSAGGNHGCSSDMLRAIDAICDEVGVYPHAWLSAHAHNYQRYTRSFTFGGQPRRVPFVVCGNGGHNINPLVRSTRRHPAEEPENDSDCSWIQEDPHFADSKISLAKFDDHNYGYLRLSVDAQKLRVAYHQVGVRSLLQSRYDLVTVDLETHDLLANT